MAFENQGDLQSVCPPSITGSPLELREIEDARTAGCRDRHAARRSELFASLVPNLEKSEEGLSVW